MKLFCNRSAYVVPFLVVMAFLASLSPKAAAQTATLSNTSHAFGSSVVSATKSASIKLSNTSTTTALSISSMVLSDTTNFQLSNPCGSSVAARGSCTITITFAPTAVQSFSASVVISDNAASKTQTISLTGTGTSPISVSPNSHAFGSVPIGSPATAPVTITNKGTAAVSFSLSGLAAPFAASIGSCSSVAGGATCSFNATFTPTTTGQVTDTLTVASAVGTETVALRGTGTTPVTITPNSTNFGSVAVGSTSAASLITLTNKSTAALVVTATTSAPFAATGCNLPASGSCQVSATYAPTATGAQTGTISLNYGVGTASVTVRGTGTSPVTITPTTQAFGNVAIGTTSAAENFTVTNKGTVALNVAATTAAPFSASGCGTLGAGASCTIAATYTPTAAAQQTGTVAINYGVGTTNVNVRGTGIAPVTVAPTSIAFSTTLAVGTPSAAHTVTFTNKSTTTAVSFTSITPSPASYAITGNTCGAGVAPSSSCVITLVFTPATTGSIPGTLTFVDSAAGGPQVVTLSGAGQTDTLTAIAVTSTATSFAKGLTAQLTATGTYRSGKTGNINSIVTWTSNSPDAGVSATGLVTGLLAGPATITASVAGSTVTGSIPLTVLPAAVVSLVVDPPVYTQAAGFTLQLTAAATYTDGTTGDVTSTATWTSSNTTEATVVAGLVSALKVGTLTITATAGGVSNSVQFTVTPPVLVSIAITPQGVSLGLNGTQQYTANGTFSDNSVQNLAQTTPPTAVTWVSLNPQVVGVDNNGLATVLAASNVAVAIEASAQGPNGTITSTPTFLSALSTLPVNCSAPTIDMKILVVNNAASAYADFPAIQQILNYVGTPYDVVDVAGNPPTLSDGDCHGYYQGVIFAYGGDFYGIPAWQQALISYESTFKVRQVNWFDFPDTNFGLGAYNGNFIPSTQTYTANFTAAAAPVFFYANTNTPLAFANAGIYLVPPDNTMGTATPLITDSAGNALSVVITYPDGRQYLTQTFDSNASLKHDLIVAYGLLNWVTRGIFLGDYHVYATQSIDDFFIDDSEWIPSTTCLTNLITRDRTIPDASNLPVMRVNSADMLALVNWQKTIQSNPLTSQFELVIAMNGVGTASNGDWTGLTAPVTSTSASGGVATITSPGLSALPGEMVTISGSKNGGGVINGTFTIQTVTQNATTSPGSAIFTVNIPSTASIALAAETNTTATIPDDLTANLQQYQQFFHWISHTYDHPSSLTGLCKSTTSGIAPSGATCGDPDNPAVDDIDLEILTNLWVAKAVGGVNLDTDESDAALQQLTFTDYDPTSIVTPGVTGLNDPDVPGYMYADGIRWAVSDTSVTPVFNPDNNNGPNPSPNVGIANSYATGVYEIPRHPNDVFFNAANWADDQAEFVCIYSNYVPPNSPAGTIPVAQAPFDTYNAGQILDFTAETFVTNMLMGDMDPQMFHQPNLHFQDNYAALSVAPVPDSLTGLTSPHISSLISDTYDLTFSKYQAIYNLPVLNPTMPQLGALMQNRNSYNLSGVTASIIGAGTPTATVSLTMPANSAVPSAVIPVTGVKSTGSEVYGNQNISHINMTPGLTLTFPLP